MTFKEERSPPLVRLEYSLPKRLFYVWHPVKNDGQKVRDVWQKFEGGGPDFLGMLHRR